MEQELGLIYNKLANQLISMIPGQWEDISYLGEVEKGQKSWTSTFYYTDIEKEEIIRSHNIPRIYHVPMDIYKSLLKELDTILLELYYCFVNNEQDVWEQVIFTVNSSGKFNIDFRYDVMTDDDGGHLTREIIWAHEMCGYTPKDGTYQKEILDKYLNK